MSEPVSPAVAERVDEPYAGLEGLRAEHSALLRRRRSGFHDGRAALLDEIETFLRRGHATGAVLVDGGDRVAAQGLLTYWSNILYRAGREILSDALAPFDPARTPELAGADYPYVRFDRRPQGEAAVSGAWD